MIKRSTRINKIAYDEVCAHGFGHHSTIEELDYKFFEDITTKDVLYSMAEEIALRDIMLEICFSKYNDNDQFVEELKEKAKSILDMEKE